MAHYKGSEADGLKARMLANQREAAEKAFQKATKDVKDQQSGASIISGLESDTMNFKAKDSVYEDAFRNSTVGLVSHAEFKAKRAKVEALQVEQSKRADKAAKKAKKAKKQKRERAAKALSFADDEQEEEEEAEVDTRQFKKAKKDPTVATHFLPDKNREEEEQRLRDSLAAEWRQKQDEMKEEEISITYSYWDGAGHRFQCKVKKGDTIGYFLETCRRSICDKFLELRSSSQSDLMYVKEDLIIPNHYTFYELIVMKARGKTGPLFHFDVFDDIKAVSDVRVQNESTHAGKIVTKNWYDRNAHVYPVKRWETYDPKKKY